MKMSPFRLPFIALICALAAPAFAEDLDDPVLSELDPLPMTMDTLDLNEDGVVSQEEFTSFHLARVQKYFKLMDKDGDNQLQSGEVVAEAEARKKIQVERLEGILPDFGRRKTGLSEVKPTAGTRGPAGPFSRRGNQ